MAGTNTKSRFLTHGEFFRCSFADSLDGMEDSHHARDIIDAACDAWRKLIAKPEAIPDHISSRPT
jgi:hypothetical protein